MKMVRLTKVRKDSNEYYILAHNIRKGVKVLRREKYLGLKIPENIEVIKEEFEHDLFEEIYGSDLEAIHQQYINNREQMLPIGVEKLNEDFAIKFTYDSNRIEGGSLTRNETRVLLLHDQAPQRPLKDILETKAHYELLKHIQTYNGEIGFNVILEWHHSLLKDSQKTIAGRIRNRSVKITGNDLIPPSPVELQPLLEDLFQWYGEKKKTLHPVELAMLVHYKFVTIHPFMDGNGRISRLIMNFILKKNEYPMYNILNQERYSYYNALSKADKREDPYVLTRYLTRNYIRVQKKSLHD
jgi:Fic family protein